MDGGWLSYYADVGVLYLVLCVAVPRAILFRPLVLQAYHYYTTEYE